MTRHAGALALATALGVASLVGCAQPSIPPYLDRQYVQISGGVSGQSVEAGGQDRSGAFPMAEALYGFAVLHHPERELSLEAGGAFINLGGGSEPTGGIQRVLAGVRQTFRTDERLRPYWRAGGTWNWYNFRRFDHTQDFKGPSAWLGAGLDYMLTPSWAIGSGVRLHLHRHFTHRSDDWTTSADLGVHLTFRF